MKIVEWTKQEIVTKKVEDICWVALKCSYESYGFPRHENGSGDSWIAMAIRWC